jgi:hypothetical protein
MAKTYKEQIGDRVKAAWINGGPRAAQPRGVGHHGQDRYTVTSRDGKTRYTVNVFGTEDTFCDCPAGLNGVLCWHVCAALLRRLADEQDLNLAASC